MGCADGRLARRRANQVEALVDRSEFDPWHYDRLPWESSNISLKGAAEEFIAAKTLTCRPKTILAYGTALRGLLKTLPRGFPLAALAPKHVVAYVLASEVSDATRRHRYRHIRTFVRWARESSLLSDDRNPLKGIRLPKEQKTLPAFLGPDDLDRVITAIDAWTELQASSGRGRPGENVWLKDVVLVGAYTGLRLGELAAAQWNWVDLSNRTLSVRHTNGFSTKSGRERCVPLAGPAFEVVSRMADERDPNTALPTDPLFAGPRGNGINPSRTSKRFKHFVRLAKLDDRLHFHSLRHSCGSMLALAGVPSVVIAEVLGHASTATTAIYVHAAGQHVREAMEKAFSEVS